MARVSIPVKAFQDSALPEVCVFSGVPAQNVFSFRFSGVKGGLPVNGEAVANLARFRRILLVMFGLSLLSFAVAVPTGAVVAGFLAVGFTVLALTLAIVARRRLVSGTVVGDQLQLVNVHPAFVAAIENGGATKCDTCPTLADCPSAKSGVTTC